MGAYAELDSLVALQFKAGGFTLTHNQPVHSLLFGRRTSHVRGRGLDFEELRGYVAGDDVRSIDWRVTARMQKPYVRVYSEERDRPTMLVVDQRINMFFGSKISMKSVVAAEVSALAAWRVFHQGDRVGAFVFNDEVTEEVRMRRSRATVLRILDRISNQNHLLRSDSSSQPLPQRLNEVLESVARVCHHDALILIASDFDGADEETRDLLLHLSGSNDIICCLTYDPLAVRLPPADQLVVSNGELQVELQLGQEKVRKSILEASDKRMTTILSWQHELGVPVLPLSTAEDVPQQVRHLLGKIANRGRRI
ncbi:uncharacterized protein DUF58 [Edaphobacter aggregans]|jgi:uncharacterized protein (DUF58 family)|uniref:Uncharacterized protein DUF58 n=1 Tax=Edaphobacter aggregans TaxID=570835 RepID=A0A3R9Q6I0_9BACT|nr:DUF58 domain-containing protein [Edaphobacter aggregans]RSL14611.1 uncharacterized protein DUF58 [Edaphobacter aggregans]